MRLSDLINGATGGAGGTEDVEIRGLAADSREVEDALEAHPAVNEAAVLPVPDAEFGESVFAYVTFQPDQSASESELIEHCRAMIASYKKPKHVYEIDVLPRNSTGKVVKVALRDRATKELAAT